MKRLFAIWLLGVMLLQSTGNCWIIAAFYLNRNRIAKELCVNRFESIPVCRGACYLEKKLNENGAKQERSPELKNKEITLFCMLVMKPDISLKCREHHLQHGYISPYHPNIHQLDIFRPPAA